MSSGLGLRFPGARAMGPRSVFSSVMMLVGNQGSPNYDAALRATHQQWGAALGWCSPPRKSTLSKARARVDADVFAQMWHQLLQQGLPSFGNDRRPEIAIDGTWMLLPDTHGAHQRWKQTVCTAKQQAQAVMVAGIECTTRQPVAVCVQSPLIGERDAAVALLDDLPSNSIVLGDRGYPSFAMVEAIHRRGMDCVFRMQAGAKGSWTIVRDFLASGKRDVVTAIRAADGGMIPVRLVRSQATTRAEGAPIILLTTLMNQAQYPTDAIDAMGRRRWEVEEFYKELKCQIGLETFHARDANGILQETYAAMIWMSLLAHVHNEANRRLAKARPGWNPRDPARWQLNRADALRLVVHWWPILGGPVNRAWHRARLAFDRAIDELVRLATRRRPDRSAPRKRKSSNGRKR